MFNVVEGVKNVESLLKHVESNLNWFKLSFNMTPCDISFVLENVEWC